MNGKDHIYPNPHFTSEKRNKPIKDRIILTNVKVIDVLITKNNKSCTIISGNVATTESKNTLIMNNKGNGSVKSKYIPNKYKLIKTIKCSAENNNTLDTTLDKTILKLVFGDRCIIFQLVLLSN
ncbi:hypothetical protein EMIT019CA3_300010 [Bacillus pseudomycoides]